MIRFRGFALLLVFGCCVVAQENQSERILSYSSDITVHADASLTVRETIRVYVLGETIKHGIYRDFPTNYNTPLFTRFTTTFDLQEATLDGAPVPHHEETKTNGVRTYLGDPNSLVPHGEHTYTIVYRTQHQLASRGKFDELYWNVTGNGWSFPIESAEARVHLPRVEPAGQLMLNAFTGPQGSTERAFTVAVEPDGDIVFRTTRSLHEQEGFTISAVFPRGMVARPSAGQELAKWAKDNYAIRISLVGAALTLAYFVFAWFLVGRDLAPGEFRARSEPPKGYSPAAARYLRRMGFDRQTFATSLVSLGVKKYVTISQGDKYFTIKSLKAPDNECSPDEAAVLRALLPDGGDVVLQQKNHTRIARAAKACHDALRKQYEKQYFLTNMTYALPGTLLAVGTVGAALLLSPHKADNPVLFIGAWLTGWSVGCFLLAHQVIASWRLAFKGVGQFISALFISAFATPFFAAEIVVTGLLFGTNAVWVLPLILVLALMNWLFYHLMKAPTKLGRRGLDEIDGFRAYLEGGRALPATASFATPEALEFNEYFPYAMALDLDKEWANRFAAHLSDTGQGDPSFSVYRPYWYHGTMWDRRGMTGFSSAIGSTMASEISSSSTAPASRSGGSSHGGGSSGGGGGGGGGGGW